MTHGQSALQQRFRGAARAALLSASMLGTAALAQPAADAAPAAATALPEIVVTVQGRRESLQDVPIAASSFSADLMLARGISTPLQLVQSIPNLFASHPPGLGSANAYAIRGLGNIETAATLDPAVATYVDDVILARQVGNDFEFFDVDRVEVLRGPQGTLFGRNTTGGAVNVLLHKPSDTLGGFFEASYGAYDRRLLRGSIDLPFSSAVQLKLSGYYQNDDGYVRNTTTGEKLNDNDQAGLRGAVQLRFTDNLTWNVAATYMRNNGENLLNTSCDPRDPANCSGRFATTGLVTTTAPGTASPFVAIGVSGRKAEFGLGNAVETQMYTSSLQWSGDNFAIDIITGRVGTTHKYLIDFADGRGLPDVAVPVPPVRGDTAGGLVTLNDASYRQFSQEIRLAGTLFGGIIDYRGGAYYLHEDNRTDFADVVNRGGVPAVIADRTLDDTADSLAGYVEVDAKITEQIKLTAGVRYTDEKKTIRSRDNRSACLLAPTAACLDTGNLFADPATGRAAIPIEQYTKQWTPRFAIAYQPSADLMVFASATKGFRSGGWNVRATAPAALLPFAPETAWSHELGARSEWFDKRLRVNVTGFWLEARNFQAASTFIDPASGSAGFITPNVAGYRNRGVELEVAAVPVRGLTVHANLGYQNDRYKVGDTLMPDQYGVKAVRQQQIDCQAQLAAGRVPLAPGADNAADCAVGIIDADGNIATPVRTPDFSIAIGGSYDFPIPVSGIILTPSINAIYRSALQTGTANATIFTGGSTAGSGAGYPANPFGGDVITGSLTRAYWQVGAALMMRTDDGNWTMSLECENCLDAAFVQSSLANYSYLSPPRTWQLRAKRVF